MQLVLLNEMYNNLMLHSVGYDTEKQPDNHTYCLNLLLLLVWTFMCINNGHVITALLDL